jgi:hypothetical protein
MKATARQRAHRKRRRDSGIVGQATTDEPIDTRVRACYAYSTHVLIGSGGGTASARLLRLSRCRVCFLRSFLRSLCTVGIEQPSSPGLRKARLLVLMETVELLSHRFHSVTTATK